MFPQPDEVHPGDQRAIEPVEVAIGPPMLEQLRIAFEAKVPLLIEGPTGIGKSEIVAAFAAQAGIGLCSLNLSLLEPADLVGMPIVRDGKSTWAPPEDLPMAGAGILMIDELNRAERHMLQPCLQLLTERRLHGYRLPPGWCVVAAINPDDGTYHVTPLDPALCARFQRIRACADRRHWLPWARRHLAAASVLAVVEAHERCLETVPPRSWTLCAAALAKVGRLARCEEAAVAAVRGWLPPVWADIVLEQWRKGTSGSGIDLDVILRTANVALLAELVQHLTEAGRTDQLEELVHRFGKFVTSEEVLTALDQPSVNLSRFEDLAATLPGDRGRACMQSLIASPQIPALLRSAGVDVVDMLRRGYRTTGVEARVRDWRAGRQDHRIAMLVRATTLHLHRGGSELLIELRRGNAGRIALGQLIRDLGSEGARDLVAWLRARGIEWIQQA